MTVISGSTRPALGSPVQNYCALGRSEDTWTCPKCNKPNKSSILYTIPDTRKDHETNLSTNPLLFDSISDITHSTRASTTSEPSLSSTCNSFNTSDVFQTYSPKPKVTSSANTCRNKPGNLKNLKAFDKVPHVRLLHKLDILSGVPQGTVLGLLLFLAFINNLPDVINHLHQSYLLVTAQSSRWSRRTMIDSFSRKTSQH